MIRIGPGDSIAFYGAAPREPNPWTGCRFEQEAREPTPRCACGCGAEVSNPGDYYSDECQETAERAAADEARAELEEGR